MDFRPAHDGNNRYVFSIESDKEFSYLETLTSIPITIGRVILGNALNEAEELDSFPKNVFLTPFDARRIARLVTRPIRSQRFNQKLSEQFEYDQDLEEMVRTSATFLDKVTAKKI